MNNPSNLSMYSGKIQYLHFMDCLKTLRSTTGCPTKNYTFCWRAVAPLNFELGIKVRGVLESSGSQL